MASSQEGHTHTHMEKLSLIHIHKAMEAKAFSSSSSLSCLVHKRDKGTTCMKLLVCTENKNIGQLSMYASCVQLPTTKHK